MSIKLIRTFSYWEIFLLLPWYIVVKMFQNEEETTKGLSDFSSLGVTYITKKKDGISQPNQN